MREVPKATIVLVVAGLLATTVAACGGSNDDTNAATPESSSAQTGPGSEAPGASGQSSESGPSDKADSGSGGAAEFEVKGGDNSIQEFGSEAGRSELDEAAAALQGFFDARVAGDWSKACTYLSQGTVEGFEQLAGDSKQLKGAGCGKILGALSEGVPRGALEEAAQVDAGALRVEGERAFLLYYGAADTDYTIPMAVEGGEWKVAALAGTPLS